MSIKHRQPNTFGSTVFRMQSYTPTIYSFFLTISNFTAVALLPHLPPILEREWGQECVLGKKASPSCSQTASRTHPKVLHVEGAQNRSTAGLSLAPAGWPWTSAWASLSLSHGRVSTRCSAPSTGLVGSKHFIHVRDYYGSFQIFLPSICYSFKTLCRDQNLQVPKAGT